MVFPAVKIIKEFYNKGNTEEMSEQNKIQNSKKSLVFTPKVSELAEEDKKSFGEMEMKN